MNPKVIRAVLLLSLFSFSTGCSTLNLGQQNVMALAWYQSSGEFQALCHQAYNAAKITLDLDLKNKNFNKLKKRAIVLDIDETILDNSPASAREAIDNKPYPYMWNEWIAEARAESIPGAVDFLKYADSQGVDIFYITNRAVTQADSTLDNLKKDGFPQTSRDHLKCQGDIPNDPSSNKEARRQFVAMDHRIVLFCGDNLNDFDEVFWKKSPSERADAVNSEEGKWGTQFIVLPNPVYGDWESSLYNYDYSLSDPEKDAFRKSRLKVFNEIP